jgi:hypothetical protein
VHRKQFWRNSISHNRRGSVRGWENGIHLLSGNAGSGNVKRTDILRANCVN